MFHTYVASDLSGCYVCLKWFSNVFSRVFQVFQTHVSSVSSVFFFCMLQVLRLDVSKIDRDAPVGGHGTGTEPWFGWLRLGATFPTTRC
jgi:hypothetical protein